MKFIGNSGRPINSVKNLQRRIKKEKEAAREAVGS